MKFTDNLYYFTFLISKTASGNIFQHLKQQVYICIAFSLADHAANYIYLKYFYIQYLRKRNFLLLSLLASRYFMVAQTDYDAMTFQSYRMADGLPGNKVYSIVQDKRGYIWIATNTGLSRFDGMTFTNFDSKSKLIHLKNDHITKVTNLDDSLLIVISQKGCNVLNVYTFKNQLFFVNDSSIFSNMINHAFDLIRLKNGNFVMLSITGYYEFSETGSLVYRKDYFNPKDKSTKKFLNSVIWGRTEILDLGENKLAYYAFKRMELVDFNTHRSYKPKFAGVLGGFSGNSTLRLKISSDEYVFLKIRSDSIFYFNTTTSMLKGFRLPFENTADVFQGPTDIFCMGGGEYVVPSFNSGFYTFRIKNKSDIVFDSKNYLANYNCISAYKDKEGRAWICTFDGFLKEKNHNALIKSYPINRDESESIIYSSICVLNNKIFVQNASETNSLKVLDAETKELLYSTTIDEEGGGSIVPFEIVSYYKDTLWISTNTGIMWLNANNYDRGKVKMPFEIEGIPLRMSDATPDGKAWMNPIYQQLYVQYDIKTRKFTWYDKNTLVKPQQEQPIASCRDADGNVWFNGIGLQRWNNSKKCFDTLITDFGKTGENIVFFSDLSADTKGNLWSSIPDRGFLKYNVRTKKTERVDLGNYIPIQTYSAFSDMVNDFLWLGYADRLIRFDTEKRSAMVFDQNEGMPDGIFTSWIQYSATTDEFLSSINGKNLISFKNKSFDSLKKEIFVEYVSGGSEYLNYNSSDTIQLNYKNNTVTIKFSVLDFNLKYPRKFVYSIDNNSAWNTIAQTQPVFLYNLSPGWHNLSIKPLVNAELYNTLNLSIYIIPPFWRTIWFYILLGFLFILVTTLIVIAVIRRARKENELMIELKEFELKALHAQMNPHFIFNCLNSIKALIVNEKNAEASRYINSFSKLVRLNLEHSRKPFITLKENIEYIDRYVQSEKIRFKEFTYSVSVDEELELEHIMVVPMLLQPIVENAIWHGLYSINKQRILSIRYTKVESGVKCVIEDNGIGIKESLKQKLQSDKVSVGMENIRQRISLFNQKYKLNYTLDVIDKGDTDPNQSGTLVVVFFNTRKYD